MYYVEQLVFWYIMADEHDAGAIMFYSDKLRLPCQCSTCFISITGQW